jgi:hypothetical protein
LQQQRQRDVVGHAQVRQHVEGLEHEAEALAPQMRLRGFIEAGHIDVEDAHGAGVDGVERGDAVQQGRLADTRLADHRDELAACDVEVDVAEDHGIAIALGEASHSEDAGDRSGGAALMGAPCGSRPHPRSIAALRLRAVVLERSRIDAFGPCARRLHNLIDRIASSHAMTCRCGMLRSQVSWRFASWRVAAVPVSAAARVGPSSSAAQACR